MNDQQSNDELAQADSLINQNQIAEAKSVLEKNLHPFNEVIRAQTAGGEPSTPDKRTAFFGVFSLQKQ